MTKDEALKLALEALESCETGHITDGGNQWHDEKLVDKAITAIKEALAQPAPVQEPVAWVIWFCGGPVGFFEKEEYAIEEFEQRNLNYPEESRKLLPLYTTPPAQPAPVAWMEMVTANLVREGINKHKARELAEHFYGLAQRTWVSLTDEDIKAVNAQVSQIPPIDYTTTTYAKAIEAKLKEKNT